MQADASGSDTRKDYHFVNALRAAAAFWVLCAHCAIWGGWWGLQIPNPKLAVDLFMMISGFLMCATTTMEGPGSLEIDPNRKRFWCKRFFRIAPAYYLSLAIAWLLGRHYTDGFGHLQQLNPSTWAGNVVYDPNRIEYTPLNAFLHITFVFGLHPRWSFSTFLPDWSLSLEMQFYFVFPFVMVFITRIGVLAGVFILAVLSLVLTFFVASRYQFYEPSLLFFKMPYFLAGILAFYFITGRPGTSRPYLVIAALVCSIVEIRSYGVPGLWNPAFAVLMMLLGTWERRKATPRLLEAFLNSKVIRMASDASYGVYLFHGFFISAIGLLLMNYPAFATLSPPRRMALLAGITIPGSYLVGWLVSQTIEKWGIAAGYKLMSWGKRGGIAPQFRV